MFKKAHSYDVAGATAESKSLRIGSAPEVIGTFKRKESVALRGGGARTLRKMVEKEKHQQVSAPNSRRSSESHLRIPYYDVAQLRRNSSPNINLVLDEVVKMPESGINSSNRHSTYLDLLEEVVSELNLNEHKNDEANDASCNCDLNGIVCAHKTMEEESINIAFDFLNAFEADNLQVLKGVHKKQTFQHTSTVLQEWSR